MAEVVVLLAMFQPYRYQGHAVLDIRILVASKSLTEERIYLEAIRRIPEIFAVGDRWGKERGEAVLWIDESTYDRIVGKAGITPNWLP